MTALKIGVLTFHRCINYGSYWQARSLAEGLQQKGNSAVILDHHSGRVNIAEWKCALQPVLPTAVPASDYPLYREKIEKFFDIFPTLPLSSRFYLDQPGSMDDYDLVVVGSDEVWNLFHPWYGNNPLFYGDGLKTQMLISYAASFGNYPASWGLEAEWSNRLRNFDLISVRDENSQDIVRNALGLEPEMVLDPCLQFDLEPDAREHENFEGAYVAVYGHNFSTFFIEKIQQWARARNLPLVSIGYRNDWADRQWITADPHDFTWFIKKAQAVATNFFHGCVFALRNGRPFVCETTPYRSIKLTGLMNQVGGQNHMVSEATPSHHYYNMLDNPLDPQITQNIAHLRQRSDAFLEKALGLKNYQYA